MWYFLDISWFFVNNSSVVVASNSPKVLERAAALTTGASPCVAGTPSRSCVAASRSTSCRDLITSSAHLISSSVLINIEVIPAMLTKLLLIPLWTYFKSASPADLLYNPSSRYHRVVNYCSRETVNLLPRRWRLESSAQRGVCWCPRLSSLCTWLHQIKACLFRSPISGIIIWIILFLLIFNQVSNFVFFFSFFYRCGWCM